MTKHVEGKQFEADHHNIYGICVELCHDDSAGCWPHLIPVVCLVEIVYYYAPNAWLFLVIMVSTAGTESVFIIFFIHLCLE